MKMLHLPTMSMKEGSRVNLHVILLRHLPQVLLHLPRVLQLQINVPLRAKCVRAKVLCHAAAYLPADLKRNALMRLGMVVEALECFVSQSQDFWFTTESEVQLM